MPGRLWLLPILMVLSACNMVISETPMFDESDRASVAPKDGIWLTEIDDCKFDANNPEVEWPECAGWLVVRDAGRQILMNDGKGQSQQADYLIVEGSPLIVQTKVDDEKEPGAGFYGFYGLEPGQIGPDGRFEAASIWEAKCGIQGKSMSDIKPFPGISSDCRPTSKDAIRSAALASRSSAEQPMTWRWLRAEAQ